MNIHYSRLPAIVNALESADREKKMWIGMDARIQFLSAVDFHFFDSYQDALDFQHFNRTNQKEITLLPVTGTLDFIYESADASLKNGIQEPNVVLDAAEILAFFEEYKFNYTVSGLSEMMDRYDWNKVFYDPLEGNVQAESFDDKLQFNRLEHLVEQLSSFASESRGAQTAVADLLNRHWKDTPMEFQMADVLTGRYAAQKNINQLNTNVMNDKNVEFLKGNLKFTGFGESLFDQLEKNIREGKPAFQLHFTTQIGNKPFDATLDFKKGDKSDFYFYNGYRASFERSDGKKMEQYIEVEKGKGITGKEAYNLMQGRAVVNREKIDHLKKDEKEALAVKPWIQLDFDKPTKNGYAFKAFNEGYGYNLREAVGKFAVIEMDGSKQESDLLKSLERGNTQKATMEINGKVEDIYLAANPQYKTVNVYDSQFKMIKHEYLPLRNAQAGQPSIGQEQKQERPQTVNLEQKPEGQKQTARQKNEDKNTNGLLQKKRTRNNKGMKMS